MKQNMKYKILGLLAISISIVILIVMSIGTTNKTEATRETVAFFTIPVHIVLPNDNYVKSYTVQTNERVNLRSMLAFHDIATFSGNEIKRINEYDEKQKLVKSFEATTEQPFYLRVVAKNEAVQTTFEAMMKPVAELEPSYLATEGIEIIIEQPLYNPELETETFLTQAELKQSIQEKTIFLQDPQGYYDEYGEWIDLTPEVDETWDVEVEDAVIICSVNQQLIDGVCQQINEQPSEEISPPVVESEPTVTPSIEPTPPADPVPPVNDDNSGTTDPPVSDDNSGTTEPPASGDNSGTTDPPVSDDNSGTTDPPVSDDNSGTTEPSDPLNDGTMPEGSGEEPLAENENV